ncbi:hypothetical protein PGT21_014655 [Puccinia graminis f. sp. tritici]|uniref:Dynamin-type G domain-containing protein n=1 Tax=Puccinia graminis f. sp. tritici TaxID=56615 RepID=A0A5B0NVW4_PUCGR|nr:hypothetical protein PGT21_014655 [Puccinia graminis f. sp. tritici]KAA1093255.1 hypothetical protein PGTUg99_003832 [Puccinia graminis f. sp. tritici]
MSTSADTTPAISCHRSHLDKVDQIRKLGRMDRISLPQIVVVGDQSSGKSALLEMISGVTLPKDSGKCTCFPTEVSMRPAEEFSAKVLIEGKIDSRVRLPNSREEVAGVIEDAKKLIMEGEDQDISEKVLTIELSGPQLPMLTLVDLPGYVQTYSQGQSATLARDIEKLVEKYLLEPRTIILAVIPVNRDFETNVAIKHIRDFDEEGKRTMCVLTKPDLLDLGTEGRVLEILAGKKMHLSRGYHIIKNKNFEDCRAGDSRDVTLRKESIFFKRSPWSDISVTNRGIPKLIERLTNMLSKQIEKEFFGIKKDLIKNKHELEEQLTQLGPGLSTDIEKLNLLNRNINLFMKQFKNLVDGNYSEGGFDQECFIRATVQNLHQGFHREIIKITNVAVSSLDVAKVMEATRGRELKGMLQFQPFVILCRQVVQKWLSPTERHIEEICQLASDVSVEITEKECNPILTRYISERMSEFFDQQLKRMHTEASELLDDELSSPFTLQDLNVGKHWRFEDTFPSIPTFNFGVGVAKPPASNSRSTTNEPEVIDYSKVKSFLREYCLTAANRYIDAICLYVIERGLFRNCYSRGIKWFEDDPLALSQFQEPQESSELREKLPIEIKRFKDAIAILGQPTH